MAYVIFGFAVLYIYNHLYYADGYLGGQVCHEIICDQCFFSLDRMLFKVSIIYCACRTFYVYCTLLMISIYAHSCKSGGLYLGWAYFALHCVKCLLEK